MKGRENLALVALVIAIAMPALNALAQSTSAAAASSASAERPSYALGFGAEWDAVLRARDVQRVTALMRASRGALPVDKFGETPLHRVPKLGDDSDVLPFMYALLASGAKVSGTTTAGYTALHMAAFSACLGCVQALLRAGATVTAASGNGSTPLHLSRPENRPALLAAGADVAARDSLGRVPLHTADTPSEDLLPVGVNVLDAQGFTPLHWAAFNGRHPAIAWLLKHGANPQLRSTAVYRHSDGTLAAQWATTTSYPAGQRAYDLAAAQHERSKWSTGSYRQAWELPDKVTPRQSLFSR